MSIWSSVGPLVGVLVGGGITWGTQWGLAARTDRLDARVARRQVRRELNRHSEILEYWLGMHEEEMTRDPSMVEKVRKDLEEEGSNEWKKHSDRLARELSDAAWGAVESAYDYIAGGPFYTMYIGNRKSPPEVERLNRAYDQVQAAVKLLD